MAEKGEKLMPVCDLARTLGVSENYVYAMKKVSGVFYGHLAYPSDLLEWWGRNPGFRVRDGCADTNWEAVRRSFGAARGR